MNTAKTKLQGATAVALMRLLGDGSKRRRDKQAKEFEAWYEKFYGGKKIKRLYI